MSPALAKSLLVGGAALALVGHAALVVAGSTVLQQGFRRALFVATIGVEVMACVQANGLRKRFEVEDRWRLTWGLVALFFAVRIVAESRLATLYFGLVPGFLERSPGAFFFYKDVLRYLYTVSDVIEIAALVSAVVTYGAAGLHFRLRKPDYLVAIGVAAIPAVAFVFRGNLDTFLSGEDPTIATYRLVAVCVGTLVAWLSLVLLRYVIQMGGGALARVWGHAVLGGVARTLSFLVIALFSARALETAELVEQTLLWVFACAWLVAGAEQRRLLEDG